MVEKTMNIEEDSGNLSERDRLENLLKKNPLYDYDIKEINLAMINEEYKFSDIFDEDFKKNNHKFFGLINEIEMNISNNFKKKAKETYEMIVYPILILLTNPLNEEHQNIVKVYFDKVVNISIFNDEFDDKHIESLRLFTILTNLGYIADYVFSKLLLNKEVNSINSHEYIFDIVKKIASSIHTNIEILIGSVNPQRVTSFLFCTTLYNDLFKIESSSKLENTTLLDTYDNPKDIMKLNVISEIPIKNLESFYMNLNIQKVFFDVYMPFHDRKYVYNEEPMRIKEDSSDMGWGLFGEED